jgi:hypothetical protein
LNLKNVFRVLFCNLHWLIVPNCEPNIASFQFLNTVQENSESRTKMNFFSEKKEGMNNQALSASNGASAVAAATVAPPVGYVQAVQRQGQGVPPIVPAAQSVFGMSPPGRNQSRQSPAQNSQQLDASE